MTTRVLIARHGETAWNRANVFRGQGDVPLNDTGREQARLLGRALPDTPIDAAYSSPLIRALETGQLALQGRGIAIREEPGLTDVDYGAWTGIEERDVAERWPDAYAVWQTAPHRAQIPEGGTLPALFERAMASLATIVTRHAGQTVALFSHRVVTKCLMLGCLMLGVERFGFIRQDNCCLNELEHTPAGYILVRLNDTSHLHQAGVAVLATDF